MLALAGWDWDDWTITILGFVLCLGAALVAARWRQKTTTHQHAATVSVLLAGSGLVLWAGWVALAIWFSAGELLRLH